MSGSHRRGRGARSWVRRTGVGSVVALVWSLVGVLVGVPAASATPWLSYVTSIQTRPFVGTSTSMGDNEGLAYVATNDTLWAIDDSPGRMYAVNRTTGVLGQVISNAQFQATTTFGGTEVAGPLRTKDLEALAYDTGTDTLYAFSGTCCTVDEQPAVFRLTRPDTSAPFALESWQPLVAPYNDLSGAGFRNGELWVASGKTIVKYDYATNTATTPFTLTGAPSAIYTLGFNPSGSDMWLTGSGAKLMKYDWATKTPVPGFTWALYTFGVNDPRAVEVIGTRLYVSDGCDYYPSGSTYAFGIRVLDLVDVTVAAPVASFTATPTSGPTPLTVAFTDTSTDNPISWSWAFGDGTSSTSHTPSKTYTTPGIYNVTLTATNPGGSSTSTPVAINVGNVPVASFTKSLSTGAVPLTVNLTDTSTNNPTAWSWDFGDGTAPGTTQSVSHVFQDPGVYNVRVTATNANGSNTSASQQVSVTSANGTLATTFIAAEDASVDQLVTIPKPNAKVLYNLSSTTAAKRSYLKFTATGLTGVVTNAKLRLWVTDGTVNGAQWYLLDTNAWSQTTLTYANAPPVAGTIVGDPGVVPVGAWLELDVTGVVSGDGTFSFANLPQSTNQERYSSREGVTPPQLVITTYSGTASVPAASFTTSVASGTAPLAVTFTDTSTNEPSSWSWNFGDGTPASTTQNPSHTYTTPGVYNVTVTATNDAGSNTSVAQAITVNEPPAAPAASFTKSASSGTAPLTVNFTDTSSHTPTAWSWNFGDGSPVSLEPFPTHTYTTAGSYGVTLTATNGVGSNTSASQTITVSAAPVAPVASFTKSASSGTAPLAVTFTDTSTNSPTSWSWDFGDGSPVSTAQNPSHTYTGPGTFNVTVTATNGVGSNTSSPQTVTVTSGGPGTTTFTATEDAYVDLATPSTVKPTTSTLYNVQSTNTQRSYLKFNVVGLAGTVTNVKLRLWVTDGTDNGAAWYRITDNSWSQTTLTWNNAPPVVTGTLVGDPAAVAVTAWLEIDITPYITTNGTYSFADVPVSANGEKYSSREGTNPPQLVITTA